ncbi:MAG: trigger factor [Candidatus Nanopelagicales bacterium]|nr:trigger factor [Candidatus Nanopelagicales bacterium]MDZ4250551.1 trigger factor [Candidatus Nanopelagicales bacterium]
MKSDVENLSETRVKFAVELPFEELADAVTAAYKKIASQVQVPGFRRGKVPRQVVDQRFGRGLVLEEVVNASVPKAYQEAVRQSGTVAIGEPNVEVTEIVDGERITFTAEVDIRPEFDLPEYRGLSIEVDRLEVTDEDVAQEMNALRDRFSTYDEVDRPAQSGDVLLLDIVATCDGEPVEDLTRNAISMEVDKGAFLPGFDEAVLGASAGDDRSFEFVPDVGEFEGKSIDVSMSVKAVRERVLPEVDDELAMMASEFDTVDELQKDLRKRLGHSRLMDRGHKARKKAHEDLLAGVEIPVPEGFLSAQVSAHFGEERGDHGDEERRAEVEARISKGIRSEFLLDRIADAEDLTVEQAELGQWLVMQAPQYGMSADQFAKALVEAGQIQSAVGEVRRTKALALVLENAVVVDTAGEPVDLSEIDRSIFGGEAEDESDGEAAEGGDVADESAEDTVAD